MDIFQVQRKAGNNIYKHIARRHVAFLIDPFLKLQPISIHLSIIHSQASRSYLPRVADVESLWSLNIAGLASKFSCDSQISLHHCFLEVARISVCHGELKG